MTTKEKIKCKAIALKIKNGVYGEFSVDRIDEIMKEVKKEYFLTKEMVDYIVTLLNENEN